MSLLVPHNCTSFRFYLAQLIHFITTRKSWQFKCATKPEC